MQAVRNFFDSDIWWSFTRSPVTVVSAIVAAICIGGAVFTMQQAGFSRVGFISEPAPGAVTQRL